MSPRRIAAVFVARNREFMRDRSALAWTVILPIAIVFGFAFAFSGSAPERFLIGVVGMNEAELDDGGASLPVLQIEHVEYTTVASLAAGRTKLRRHQLDLLIDPASGRYWISDASPSGYLMERVLRGVTAAGDGGYTREEVPGRTIRYVDWLVPGLLAMNMMFTALIGVGFVIVRYRKNGVLKRLKATPLTPAEFLIAQVGSRLIIITAITSAIFVGSQFFLDFPVYGHWLNLLAVLILGAICLISLGLIIAARTASEELAGGLLNMMSWPMMFLSGVWFSTEGLHPWLQALATALPLTHVIDAARGVMIEGQGLVAIAPHLGILAAMSAVFLGIGAALFRWE